MDGGGQKIRLCGFLSLIRSKGSSSNFLQASAVAQHSYKSQKYILCGDHFQIIKIKIQKYKISSSQIGMYWVCWVEKPAAVEKDYKWCPQRFWSGCDAFFVADRKKARLCYAAQILMVAANLLDPMLEVH